MWRRSTKRNMCMRKKRFLYIYQALHFYVVPKSLIKWWSGTEKCTFFRHSISLFLHIKSLLNTLLRIFISYVIGSTRIIKYTEWALIFTISITLIDLKKKFYKDIALKLAIMKDVQYIILRLKLLKTQIFFFMNLFKLGCLWVIE